MKVREVLRARAAMEKAVRAFFSVNGFLEVTTPAALPHPNLDPNVRPLALNVAGMDGAITRHWLHTSPEIAMKKLLAIGSGDIFQVCQVYRDGELTDRHRPEFSMLEWYRTKSGYRQAMEDTAGLIRSVCRAGTGREVLSFGGREYDLAGKWREVTMAEAFARHAGIDSFAGDELVSGLEKAGIPFELTETQESLFMRLYVELVEPHLGQDAPTIIRDFPDFLGTMAARKEGEPGVLERFEVYIAGMELANGYTELTDTAELAGRMEKVRQELAAEGVEGLSVDPEFLDAAGRMPPCSGVSVGLDRLLMLLLGKEDIAEVVFPFSQNSEVRIQETE
jgi:lysyl-tRNA synthetase class 2